MLVKICGFTRTQDVEAAIDAGVDAIGLVFDAGRRCLDLDRGAALVDAVKSSHRTVECVAVTGQLTAAQVAPIRALGVDGVQAGVAPFDPDVGGGSAYVLPAFFDSDDLLERVRKHRDRHPMPRWAPGSRSLRGLINLDSAAGGGTGQRADWARAAEICALTPTVLAGGLRSDNVTEAITCTGAVAVDVCSGVECSPGVMDAGAMRAFVAAARDA